MERGGKQPRTIRLLYESTNISLYYCYASSTYATFKNFVR
jgi:hypothetical protein